MEKIKYDIESKTIAEMGNDPEFKEAALNLYNATKNNKEEFNATIKYYQNGETSNHRYIYIHLQNLLIADCPGQINMLQEINRIPTVKAIIENCSGFKINTLTPGFETLTFINYDISLFFEAISQRIYINMNQELSDAKIFKELENFIKNNEKYFNIFFLNVWLPQINKALPQLPTIEGGANSKITDSENSFISLTTQYYDAMGILIAQCLSNINSETFKIHKSRFKSFCKGQIEPDEAIYSLMFSNKLS